jgi:DNA-binding NtrC family response regulator
MSAPLRLLILEDRPSDAELMLRELRRAGFTADWRRVDTETDFVAALDPAVDLILADYSLPQFNALQAPRLLQEHGLDIPFIIVTGSISEEVAVECMKQGAADYPLKDRMARLGQAVTHALEQKRLRGENRLSAEALRDSEARFRVIFEHANDAIHVCDAADEILQVNPRMCELMG